MVSSRVIAGVTSPICTTTAVGVLRAGEGGSVRLMALVVFVNVVPMVFGALLGAHR